ncbi:MAG: formyltetrahydrofolate deformylase [Candidatus Peribacteraceae bacterium]|nr:formyltetrahydrofolate deformylase [Candidatus Peribacteraceae bacterium]
MKLATVTVTGPDRPGIIATTTTTLFENGVNIVSLDEKVVNGIFSMVLAADVSKTDFENLKKDLRRDAKKLDLDIRANLHDTREKKNLAILVTREPLCLEEIVKNCRSGKIRAEPVVVIGNRPDLKDFAKKLKIPFHLADGTNKEERERKTVALLKRYNADFIALARHMQILSPEFVARYEGRVINIHPSLLPAFPGARPYDQALEAGVEIVGVTAHFVTTDLDRGPVICQDSFRIRKSDSIDKIRERGQQLEAKVLTRACELYSKDKLYMQWGKVHFR